MNHYNLRFYGQEQESLGSEKERKCSHFQSTHNLGCNACELFSLHYSVLTMSLSVLYLQAESLDHYESYFGILKIIEMF